MLPEHSVALYVDNDPFVQEILWARMAEGSLPHAPIHHDVRTVYSHMLTGPITHIVAGFPCQDISLQGVRRGISKGTRSGLFYEIIRLAHTMHVPFLYLENVQGLFGQHHVWYKVYSTLHKAGYDVWWTRIGACHAGAPHRRYRWFALCRRRHNTNHIGSSRLRGLDRNQKILWNSGCMINGYMQSITNVDDTCDMNRGVIQSGPLHFTHELATATPIHRWATPRTNVPATVHPRNLIISRNHLGTQLRFAHDTPESVSRFQTPGITGNPMWIEWLMGFPLGWTDPVSVHRSKRHPSKNPWLQGEPNGVPRLIQSKEIPHSKSRNHALGNACVPQSSAIAWAQLHAMMARSKHG